MFESTCTSDLESEKKKATEIRQWLVSKGPLKAPPPIKMRKVALERRKRFSQISRAQTLKSYYTTCSVPQERGTEH
jgi:hypothetical protein